MKLGSKTAAIVLLFVGLVLVNYLASQLPLRADATAERIYTLSDGTKSLLGKIEEPITIDFYFSKDAGGLPIHYKNYADRVEEMLRQYVRAARGKLVLNVVNPKPDTPEEERATASGLQPQVVPGTGEQVYFGLVATQADQQKNIPNLNPQREQFLEYDLSQLLYSVEQFDKKKLGLITSLPLQAPPFNPMMMQMGQRPPQSQFVISEWEKSFEIVPIEATATELPANLDALAVIHPQNLSPKLQYAIDQFLLGGKPVFLAVDPSSYYLKRQGGQAAMFGGPQPNVSSDVPTLLNGWGLTYNAQNIVGDPITAAPVPSQSGGNTHMPIWMFLTQENVNAQSTPTAQLNSLWFIEAGSFALKPGTALDFTPLIESTAQSGEMPGFMLQRAQPEEIARQLVPSGKKTLAALVRGKFKTAFSDGAPNDPPPADAEKKEDKPAAPTSAPASNSLKESRDSSTLILVGDTDWLLDDFMFDSRYRQAGILVPSNDNLAFGSNALEFLAGSQDLISIRGKGNSLRPFTVVRAMEVEAQKKHQEQLTALESQINEVQSKLTELQGKKTEGNRLVASPEVQKTIEEFQQQEAQMRRERRDIRRALREDIDALENGLLLVNLLATPLLVGAFGLWFYRARKK